MNNVLAHMIPACAPRWRRARAKDPKPWPFWAQGSAFRALRWRRRCSRRRATWPRAGLSRKPLPRSNRRRRRATPAPAAPAEAGPEPAPAAPGAPPAWRVDTGASAINSLVYIGESGQTLMRGRFTRWRRHPLRRRNLQASAMQASKPPRRRQGGLSNNTLSTAPWFNSAANPTPSPPATSARAGMAEARGVLSRAAGTAGAPATPRSTATAR